LVKDIKVKMDSHDYREMRDVLAIETEDNEMGEWNELKQYTEIIN